MTDPFYEVLNTTQDAEGTIVTVRDNATGQIAVGVDPANLSAIRHEANPVIDGLGMRAEDLDLYEPHLDDVPREQLGELDPMYPEVCDALTTWANERKYLQHGLGTFLEDLAARGYRVTPIEPLPPIETLLGAPKE